ncbi:hypothetical protein V1283_003767 [Bradyrhizobium sp. AZCC 2262]
MADTTSASIVTLHQPQPARAKTPAERARAYRQRKRAAALPVVVPALENAGALDFEQPAPASDSKAMPVILTTDEVRDVWMRALGRGKGATAPAAG